MGDVGGNEVDASHVEPDGHCRLAGDFGVVGVDLVGTIDVGAAVPGRRLLQGHDAPLLWDSVQRQLLFGQHGEGLLIDRDGL